MNANAQPLALVIDDEIQIRRLLKITLEGGGYRVLEAATGQEGLSAVANDDSMAADPG